MPAGHFTLSSSKVSLSFVQGKVFFGEQSLKPSNLALVPLGHCPLLLGVLGKVADPLLQRGDFFPGLSSLSSKGRTLLLELGRDLAFLHKLTLSRLPSGPLVLAGRPGVSFPVEKS